VFAGAPASSTRWNDTSIERSLDEQTKSGCALTFTSTLPEDFADEMAPQTLAGWHGHLDVLADALDGRPKFDWSKLSLDDFAELRDRYAEELGCSQNTERHVLPSRLKPLANST
jgi:hypothetical protein